MSARIALFLVLDTASLAPQSRRRLRGRDSDDTHDWGDFLLQYRADHSHCSKMILRSARTELGAELTDALSSKSSLDDDDDDDDDTCPLPPT